MATAIIMPQIGQDIKTGVIVEWRVQEGDHIEKGDIIVIVESDKATFEIEAYESGILLKILHEAGAEVPVLYPIAYLGDAGEGIPQTRKNAFGGPEDIEQLGETDSAGEEAIQETPSQRPHATSERTKRQCGAKVAVSPSARRLAEQHGIDVTKLTGTGPKGRVTKADVLAAIEAKGGVIDTQTSSFSSRQVGLKAVIFDCDGVLADTERDGHRVAFNRAFAKKGLDIEWDVALYGELLKVAGGKERMWHYFDTSSWPTKVDDRGTFIKELHKLKTDIYMKIIDSGELPLRPGVARLVDEAIAENITLAVCSTSNERAVNLVVERLLGFERKSRFAAILAGDVVSKKKPDPEIYNLALQRLQLDPRQCIVVEDSRNGLLAAKAAGMCCVVTTNGYTEDEDFTQADLVVPELGDSPNVKVTIQTLKDIVERR